jgi:tol-pal system protein YbgF
MLIRKNYKTAIVMMAAVIVVGVFGGGCATTRHVHEIRADIARLESQNQETQETLSRVEAAVSSGSTGDSQLRAEMATTISSLSQQIDALLESHNDLMQIVDKLSRQPQVIIRNSPGSQPDTEIQQPPVVVETPRADCASTYDEAFILVRQGEYTQAIAGFRSFIEKCPNHEDADNAYYWIGESFYSLEKFADAIIELEYMVEEYKSSPTVGKAVYKLARSKQELDKKDEAIVLYQRLVDDHPGSLEAEQAKERLKELK